MHTTSAGLEPSGRGLRGQKAADKHTQAAAVRAEKLVVSVLCVRTEGLDCFQPVAGIGTFMERKRGRRRNDKMLSKRDNSQLRSLFKAALLRSVRNTQNTIYTHTKTNTTHISDNITQYNKNKPTDASVVLNYVRKNNVLQHCGGNRQYRVQGD